MLHGTRIAYDVRQDGFEVYFDLDSAEAAALEEELTPGSFYPPEAGYYWWACDEPIGPFRTVAATVADYFGTSANGPQYDFD